jgi:hypothetical protein
MVKIELEENIINNNLKAKDLIKIILESKHYLHFKISDIKGALTKENVYNQLSISKIYNDKEQPIKRAYIKDNYLFLEF